jgi:A/G-specific adenine glycosylase
VPAVSRVPLLRKGLLVAPHADSSAFFPGAEEFVGRVIERGRACYRDLPWRRTSDPYAVLVSEIMLQQTQVSRVIPKYELWLREFPTIDALAAASLESVLMAWRGLGYNRRAIALKRISEQVVRECGGLLPAEEAELRALPGVGPSTAAGVLTFAHGEVAVYLETNVRAVFLHECFARRDGVSDREIVPLVRAAVGEAARQGISPREWYWALLDYGAQLKRAVPNPSRRSAHHSRQSRFEGSRRQKRAWLLHAVAAVPGKSAEQLAHELAVVERSAGRVAPAEKDVERILAELASEGFLVERTGCWLVANEGGSPGVLSESA